MSIPKTTLVGLIYLFPQGTKQAREEFIDVCILEIVAIWGRAKFGLRNNLAIPVQLLRFYIPLRLHKFKYHYNLMQTKVKVSNRNEHSTLAECQQKY